MRPCPITKTAAILSVLAFLSHVESFALRKPGGGRAPGQPDMPSLEISTEKWKPRPMKASEAKLTVIQITDVYTLENFASLKTLISETKAQSGAGTVVSMLTGDFLAPYLLSSVDRGAGMMKAIAKTPIDYLTWGNHEADIDHRTVCRHVRGYPGTWLNSNMRDHEAMESQKPFDVIEVCSEDGSNVRRIGLVAVLSDDPSLYSQFKQPGAFGGATIDCPWETLKKYKDLLEGPEYNCDVVIPLQHTYVPDDHKTCQQFDFPVILSGHDHHTVDEVVDGTRLLKPGMNGIYATMLDLSWEDKNCPAKPTVRATFAEVNQWEPDEKLKEECERAYDALLPLRNTELARIPETFRPFTSANSRGSVCTVGQYICTLLRSALNSRLRQRDNRVDAVLLMGGNIRGGTEYENGSYFSLEALEAEIKSEETVAIVPMPGWLISDGIVATHEGEPIPGWIQYDTGVVETTESGHKVTHVAGQPLEPDRIYRVATKVSDLTNGQSAPLTDYFTKNPQYLPPKGAYVNIHAELMSFFAKNMWRKIWESVAPSFASNKLCDPDHCYPEERLEALDSSGDGTVTVDEIHSALRDVVGLSIHEEEKSLAEFVFSYADIATGDGVITLRDLELFCEEMPGLYENEKWRLDFPKQEVIPGVI